MQKTAGEKISNIVLPKIDNTYFNLDSLKGKRYMLSFFRFASCPFCNMRVHELVSRYSEFGDNFTIVAIFDSPLDNLQKHTEKHHAPFPILADGDNIYYKSFGIKRSYAGVLKGMITRLPTLMIGMFKGYLPLIFKGHIATMPADFLVDENGIIQTVYYGKDEGDHLSFEEVKAFSAPAK